MKEIIEEMKDKMKESFLLSDLESIWQKLDLITGNMLFCGIGGSYPVSLFASKVFESKGMLVKSITVEEYFQKSFSEFQNLFLVSHQGRNHGIKSMLQVSSQSTYLFTTRKSTIHQEMLIPYKIYNGKKSFVSLENTLIPIGILLSYYLKSPDIFSYIPEKIDFNMSFFPSVHIIYDESSRVAAHFLECSLVEAGIAGVTMHTKYSFCHGRSNSINGKESMVLYFASEYHDLDQLLLKNIPMIQPNIHVFSSNYHDTLKDDFAFLFQVLYFLDYLSETYAKEFIAVKYCAIVPALYHFKGRFLCEL